MGELRRQREELRHLILIRQREWNIECEAQKAVAEIEQRRDQELSILDKLIEKACELAAEVKERTVAAVRIVAERVELFFGGGERGKAAEPELAQKQASPPPRLSAEELMEQKLSALDRQMALQKSMDAKLAALDQRVEAVGA